MKTSVGGKLFIKGEETCRLHAYADPKTGGAPWTCGWGETSGVGPDTWWTQEEADRRFEVTITAFENIVSRYVTAPMTQGQFDAFVSLFYNIGPGNKYKDGIAHINPSGRPSHLLQYFNDGNILGCEAEWVKWCSPGSSVEHGLLARRQAELIIFRG